MRSSHDPAIVEHPNLVRGRDGVRAMGGDQRPSSPRSAVSATAASVMAAAVSPVR
ncbi:hypothetical protein [Nocardia cyriacigeorgica]|uniref:hypothetical protein n=1 Tax=Nocardia cyriacigeorgica TaxID=135487 RepID=UPI00148649C4|nr:hypothetical protein [Nocardia cyriacigeorgica]